MVIELSKLTLLENNPRQISGKNFERLKRDLLDDPEFLEKRPALVNKVGDSLIVYAGNMRVRAAIELGWSEIPVIIDEDIPEDIMRKRALRDNQEYGEWDYDILANEWNLEIDKLDLPELKVPTLSPSEEINVEELGNVASINFVYPYEEYLELVAQLQNAQEKLGLESNEEVLSSLLKDYV